MDTTVDRLDQVRIAAIEQMVRHGRHQARHVAAEVGCASLQHFSALFRKQTGDTPSAWRERNRLR